MKNKKWIGWLIGLVIAALVMAGIYKIAVPKPAEGSKAVTVEVDNGESELKTYPVKTDAEYLIGVIEELKETTDFTYEGSQGTYGLFLTSINGTDAVYETNGKYWAIYVNGEYGQYGVDSQPVTDGDTYRFVCESAE